jgi:hypothetical protein
MSRHIPSTSCTEHKIHMAAILVALLPVKLRSDARLLLPFPVERLGANFNDDIEIQHEEIDCVVVGKIRLSQSTV